jgi:transcriptional regulator with XRE-family HTH domain
MTPAALSEVASRLAALRAAAGLSQRELARRAGLPASVLCAYERGTRMPGADVFLRIARAAGGDVAVRTRHVNQLHAADVALQDVLALAELLPQEGRGALTYPPLRERAP